MKYDIFIEDDFTLWCMHAGMDPEAKTKLIESLYKMLVSIGVLSAENVKVLAWVVAGVCGDYFCMILG